MIEWGSLALLRPWWLLALAPLAFLAWRGRDASGLGAWTTAVDPALLAALAARGQIVAGRRGPALLTTAMVGVIVLALTGPALERDAASTYRNLDGVVVILDASRSVALGGNMVAARLAASAVARAAAPRQTALVVYAGDAYVAAPFTADEDVFDPLVAAVDGDTVPDVGSRPARALRLAHRLFEGAAMIQGDAVLISDGGRVNEPTLQEARLLGEAKVRVHTLLVPMTGAAPRDLPAPDPGALAALARAGGGTAASLDDPDDLLEALREAPAQRLGESGFSALAYADLGRLLLGLALPLALLMFRRTA